MPLFGNKKANKTEKLGDRYLAATFRERGLLGIVLADHERGAMVQNYQEHSPAAKVELPFGALIVGVNGEEVVGMPPEAVEVLIETGLRPITIVMELPEEQKYMALNARFGREGGLGIALHNRPGGGTGVTRVVRGSMAESQGVREGSLLIAINDEDVSKSDKSLVMSLVETAARPLTMRFHVPLDAPAAGSSSPPSLNSSFRNSGRSTSHDDDDALQRALSISRKEALAAQAALQAEEAAAERLLAVDNRGSPPPVQRRTSEDDLKKALSLSRREMEKAMAAKPAASSQAAAPKYSKGEKLLVDRSDGSQSECTVLSYDTAAKAYKVSMDGTDVLKNATEKMLKHRPSPSNTTATAPASPPSLTSSHQDDELRRALSISRREMEEYQRQQQQAAAAATTTSSAASASRRSHGDEDAQLARALEASRLQAALDAPARNPTVAPASRPKPTNTSSSKYESVSVKIVGEGPLGLHLPPMARATRLCTRSIPARSPAPSRFRRAA